MHWFGSLLSGSRAVLLRGVKPEWIIKTVSEERITIVWLLVPWAQDILDAIERGDIKLEDYKLDQWRLMHIGAQPVPPSLVKRWKNIFRVTNTTPITACRNPSVRAVFIWGSKIFIRSALSERPDTAGKCRSWMSRDIRKRTDVGELCVKGPGVMRCYYNNPEATAEILKDGWLFTGDMAKMDEDGFIYLVDRKKDVIITGGENIYPVQIEDFLRTHNAVKDVAVIGLPDHRLGEITAAIIELKPGISATQAEIEQFSAALPRYKRPHKIIFDAVPRNPTGKIEKPKLREKYCGGISLVEMETEN